MDCALQIARIKKRINTISSSARRLRAAIASYINPFKYAPVRAAHPDPTPTAFYRKTSSAIVPTGATGDVIIQMKIDHDGSSSITYDNIAPSLAVGGNTWVTSFIIDPKQTTNTRTVAGAVRIKYVGPALERGGVAYIKDSAGDTITTLDDVSHHLHGQVHPITNKWMYWRPKFTGATSQTGVMEGGSVGVGYAYLTGLPSNKACLLIEMVVCQEFIPSSDEHLYVAVSNEDRLTPSEMNKISATTCAPKVDQHLHEITNKEQEHVVLSKIQSEEDVHENTLKKRLQGAGVDIGSNLLLRIGENMVDRFLPGAGTIIKGARGKFYPQIKAEEHPYDGVD